MPSQFLIFLSELSTLLILWPSTQPINQSSLKNLELLIISGQSISLLCSKVDVWTTFIFFSLSLRAWNDNWFRSDAIAQWHVYMFDTSSIVSIELHYTLLYCFLFLSVDQTLRYASALTSGWVGCFFLHVIFSLSESCWYLQMLCSRFLVVYSWVPVSVSSMIGVFFCMLNSGYTTIQDVLISYSLCAHLYTW